MAPYTSLTLTHIQNIKGLAGGSRSSAARTAYPSGVMTQDFSSIQTRHKHCGALLTTERQSHLMELWLNEQDNWNTVGSTLTECLPTEDMRKQQHRSARKIYKSWRLWLQRVLNNAIFSGVYIPSSTELNCRVPGEIKRREVELDLQVSPEEIMNREVELGCESWTSFASVCSSTAVQRTLSLWLCPARQLKQQLRSALVAPP